MAVNQGKFITGGSAKSHKSNERVTSELLKWLSWIEYLYGPNIHSSLWTKNDQLPELQSSIITMNSNRVRTNTTHSYITTHHNCHTKKKKKKKTPSVKLLLCMAIVGEV